MQARVVIESPAKVNLRLVVLGREESGYHGLETIFCALSFSDTLTVESGDGGILLSVEGDVATGPTEENLVMIAARRFFGELNQAPAVRFTLRKRIPSSAGLGGGSSNAAAALLALNAFHGEPFTRQQLMQWGSEIGSDVSFFLCGSSLALGWSRGERLLALPALPPRPVLIAHPGIPFATAGAFREIAERRGGVYRPEASELSLGQLHSWARMAEIAVNQFSMLAEERIPLVASGIETMRKHRAEIALLAGSGASIFGVFTENGDTARAEQELQLLGFRCWGAATLGALPQPARSEVAESELHGIASPGAVDPASAEG
ncbi:4-(cytidine 5'-diphospho)-2-C-methyl-D-erythritol kinase [soil metagenome]